jgi:predicted molibdopterin-dependent oxidoreductase YjgC
MIIDKSLRVINHPILGIDKGRKTISIFFDGKKIKALKGDTIASALISNGILKFSVTRKNKEPRGYFCGIGLCTDCMMTVNGVRNVRTCITEVEENMKIERQ